MMLKRLYGDQKKGDQQIEAYFLRQFGNQIVTVDLHMRGRIVAEIKVSLFPAIIPEICGMPISPAGIVLSLPRTTPILRDF